MASYNLGSAVELSTTVTDDNGTLTDTTMTLTVTAPDGTTATPTPVHGTTGMYSALIDATDLDQAGTWFYQWIGTGTVEVADSGQFTILDPKPITYATLTQLKARLGIKGTGSDQDVLDTLDAASRVVDEDCDRRFWLDTAATARTYRPASRQLRQRDGYLLLVDDIGNLDGLIVEVGRGDSFSTITDYETQPENALALGEPVTGIKRLFMPWAFHQLTRVRITAKWGWPGVPSQITQATLIRAQRLYRRRDSPEGVAGFNDMGIVRLSRYDSDYQALIAPFRRPSFGSRQ